ncbi:hypothetical protein GJ698_03775 [Pseudoduganella sp. FT26W]|uniref:Uncharacterized protein n=1 Tax=Duganella aquatilis TaxID=2666082 RepID=A0A844D7I8_9BURK|nr:hypothetical protein [Duganella aquatilis]MRW83209.1 hypothetical protein [Duganella aquatilis]
MNLLLSRFLDKLYLQMQANPAAVTATLLLVVMLLGVTKYMTLHYNLRDKATSLNAKRFKAFLALLRQGKYTEVHPLELEIAFHQAYGFKLSSDEIDFALKRKNTTRLLFDIRYGKAFLHLNDTKSQFMPIHQHRLSLKTREKIVGGLNYALIVPGIFWAGLYCFVNRAGGIPILIELVIGFWIFLVLMRQLNCAHRLEMLTEEPDLPPVSKRKRPKPKQPETSALSIVPDASTGS